MRKSILAVLVLASGLAQAITLESVKRGEKGMELTWSIQLGSQKISFSGTPEDFENSKRLEQELAVEMDPDLIKGRAARLNAREAEQENDQRAKAFRESISPTDGMEDGQGNLIYRSDARGNAKPDGECIGVSDNESLWPFGKSEMGHETGFGWDDPNESMCDSDWQLRCKKAIDKAGDCMEAMKDPAQAFVDSLKNNRDLSFSPQKMSGA